MNKKTSKKEEFNNFTKIAQEWWKPEGKFKVLHDIIPLRIEYILQNLGEKKIKNLHVLDLGCGGGLTCEPLARLKANVTGIDFIKQNIEIAKRHAYDSNLKINYIHNDLDVITIKKKFDLIIMMEVLEHLDDWKKNISNIKKYLKPKGIIIISTINRTQLSKLLAIYLAENILKWVPKNTHDYNKLIKPEELKETLIKNNFIIKNIKGMNFNPITKEWKLNNAVLVNYFCTAKIN